MFYSITFAPAFERERRFRNDGNVEVSLGRGWGWLGQAIISNRPEIGLRKKLENFSPKNLEVKKKSLPLQPQSRNDSERVLWEIYIIQQVVQVLGEEIFRIDTVNRVWLWTTINGFRSEDIKKQFKQRRVWSWLRMNASDRLNTCKSRGSGGSDTRRRPAHGWVTRMQLTYQRGIARRKSD